MATLPRNSDMTPQPTPAATSSPPTTRSTTSLDFSAAGKTVMMLQQKKKQAKFKKKQLRGNSKEVSVELMELATEYANTSPHTLAYQGELSVLRTRIESFGLSIKVKDPNNNQTLLHLATAGNRTDTMLYLIEGGIPINATDNTGNTALHVAVLNAYIDALHILLNNNANDTTLNNNQDAPLHIAIRSGNIHLVEAFLQHTSINIVVPGYRNRTPLHIAAEFDYLDIVVAFNNCALVIEEFKNKYSFRLSAKDDDQLTPIHFAARCGSARVLDYMMTKCTSHGYPVEVIVTELDEENRTPLHAAINAGHLNVVKVLLKFGARVTVKNGDQIPPIHLACYQGRIDIVQAMIEHCGPDIMFAISNGGHTPLHWGARSIHGGQVIRYLIQQGANLKQVNDNGETALHCAIIYGSLDSAQELITADQTVALLCDNKHRNVIHLSVLKKRKAILHNLLKLPFAGELTRQQDSCNRTPLHYALINSLGDYVSVLITSMKPPINNLKDENGLNYLHLAARSSNCKPLSVLLHSSATNGGMLNEMNSMGMTPLHEAAWYGHLSCIELLLSKGAMSHKCYCGYTPFFVAVNHGHYDCAKVLFDDHPYQRNWSTDNGQSALHLAVKSNSASVLELCLDLDIQITRNHEGQTFLDMIIETGDSFSALAVVNHRRWQECLDFPVLPQKLHYFVQLIKTMPDIAQAVLDRCHEKGTQAREHCDYYETFDFKYLRLADEDKEERDGGEKNCNVEENQNLLAQEEEGKNMMESVAIKYETASDENPLNFVSQTHSSMEVLKQMLHSNRVSLLIHPVVKQYLKVKWRGYGRLVYGVQFALFFLQVLFLSAFIMVTNPPRLNVSEATFEVTPSNVTITEITTASTVIRSFTLGLCIINTLIWLTYIASVRLEAINFSKHELIWLKGITFAATYAFLIPWKYHLYGFSFIFWEAGAIAIFTAWFSFGVLLKPFDLFGIYVTMFLEVLSTLLKALLICLFLIIAFAFTLFILVGDLSPFTTLGDTFFITVSYLLGEINYEMYVSQSDNRALLYPILTYMFVLLAAIVLAVAVMNLLIGLAVGDIDSIKKNALLTQRSNEVRIFNKMEPWLPKCILEKYDRRYHTVLPNKPVHKIRAIWQYLWRSLKGSENEPPLDLQKALEEQQCSINSLQKQVAAMEKIRNEQHNELKEMMLYALKDLREKYEFNIHPYDGDNDDD